MGKNVGSLVQKLWEGWKAINWNQLATAFISHGKPPPWYFAVSCWWWSSTRSTSFCGYSVGLGLSFYGSTTWTLSGSLNHPKVSFIVWQFVYLWRMAGCCYHRVFLAWSARLFRLVRTSTRNIHINAHKDAQQNIVTGWSMFILSASGFNVLGSLHLSAWKLWKFV